ncbi:Translin [Galdieria sulphuraria]|nr:Translin [Galdieria sulphuraria]
MESSFFFKLNDYLEKESQCRENLRECRDRCDAAVRSAAVLVESLHKERDLSSKLQELYESLREVASGFVRLQSNVPVDEYYKYNELWRSSLSQAVAVGCLVYYLDCNQLADIFVLERIFCPKEPEASSVRIELEDYLVGETLSLLLKPQNFLPRFWRVSDYLIFATIIYEEDLMG